MSLEESGYEPIAALRVDDEIKIQWSKPSGDTLEIVTERYNSTHPDWSWAVSFLEAQQ